MYILNPRCTNSKTSCMRGHGCTLLIIPILRLNDRLVLPSFRWLFNLKRLNSLHNPILTASDLFIATASAKHSLFETLHCLNILKNFEEFRLCPFSSRWWAIVLLKMSYRFSRNVFGICSEVQTLAYLFCSSNACVFCIYESCLLLRDTIWSFWRITSRASFISVT